MAQKAKNLDRLKKHRISVPRGFTLDSSHYREMLVPLADKIFNLLGTSDSLKDSSDRIKELFLQKQIPVRSQRYLGQHLSQMPEVKTFAVRSSGIVKTRGNLTKEDSDDVSLAGQFESYLNVPAYHLGDAIKLCWASLFNTRSLVSFLADEDYIRFSEMTVLIQEMVTAKASAVMMTVDPLGDGEIGGIDFALGPCEAIVSGITSPDEISFSRKSGKVISTNIGRKEYRVDYKLFSSRDDNIHRIPNSLYDQTRLSVDHSIVHDMINIGREIETIFEKPQDIEAVVTFDDQIVITQSRAITRLPLSTVPFCYN